MKPAYTAAASVLLAEDTRIPLALAILAMSKVLREAGVSLPAKVIPDAKTPEEVIAVWLDWTVLRWFRGSASVPRR